METLVADLIGFDIPGLLAQAHIWALSQGMKQKEKPKQTENYLSSFKSHMQFLIFRQFKAPSILLLFEVVRCIAVMR